MWKRLFLLAAISTAISGCGERTVYVHDELPLYPRPELPKIRDAELKCLPDDVYGRLAHRDNAWKQYAEKLETVIGSTHAKQ